jgi:hypothetical protein
VHHGALFEIIDQKQEADLLIRDLYTQLGQRVPGRDGQCVPRSHKAGRTRNLSCCGGLSQSTRGDNAEGCEEKCSRQRLDW